MNDKEKCAMKLIEKKGLDNLEEKYYCKISVLKCDF